MRLWASLVAVITCCCLAACGGSSHSSSTQASATPAASPLTTGSTQAATSSTAATATTTTTATATAPPEVPKTKTHRHPGESGSQGGVSVGAQVLTKMTVNASGSVSPPVISVPSGVEVDILVTNRRSSVVTVSVVAILHASARLNPGSTGKLQAGVLRDGTYRILVNGTRRGQIVAGAQGGP